MIRLYRIDLSTNVERVALALAHKGLEVESIVVPYDDRREIRRVSGQDLVPVITDGEIVKSDSMEIVRDLEERYPGRPSLYPADPARRAECDLFIDWFDRTWKRPPNLLYQELSKPESERDAARIERLGAAMSGYLDLFERLLASREHLLGEFSAADIAAFPFVRFASIPHENSPHLFHRILRDFQRPGDTHPRVVDWIARVDRRPRV